jgi:dienelactone hydrolase
VSALHDPETARAELWNLLGDLPTNVIPDGNLLTTTRIDGASVEHWRLRLNDVEDVPAVLVIPDVRAPGNPAVMYMHTHSGDHTTGKDELFSGIPGVLAPYAPDLVEMGVVTLAVDSWCFGERQKNPDGELGERETFCEMLWNGRVLFGMMLFDLHQALTWLLRRDDVGEVGALGMSMGSTQAWWLSALDERVSYCVDVCCLTDFDALIAHGDIAEHSIYYFVPNLLKHFSSAEINALVAPRPRLSMNGAHDHLAPADGVEKIAQHLRAVYDEMSASSNLHVELFDVGHVETPEMRALALQWIRSHGEEKHR